MHQIIRGTDSTAELSIYLNGELTNATGNVVVSVFDADYNTAVGPVGNAYNNEEQGKYTFALNTLYTSLNRVLKVVWTYTVSGQQTYQEDFYEVYTPYASLSDIVSSYGFGARPSDVNYKSPTEIQNAEFLARMQIENYTGQIFGRKSGIQEMFGNGSDALELTQRMVSVSKIYEDGILVLDYTTTPVTNNFGWEVELTTTSKALRIINNDYYGQLHYDNLDTVMMYTGRFRDHSRYKVAGEIGWPYVPQDIRRCAVILAGDYLAQDSQWRNKYLKKVNLSEVSFELSAGAFNGTGNALVDSILDQYRNIGIVVI